MNNDDELDNLPPRSPFEWGTFANPTNPPLTIEDLEEAVLFIKNMKPIEKIEAILVTNYTVSDGALKVEYEEKKYILISPANFEIIEAQLPKTEFQYTFLKYFTGIPVIENDELVKKILKGVMEELINKNDKDSFRFRSRLYPYGLHAVRISPIFTNGS